MGSQGIFSGTISVLEKALDVRSMKHNLVLSNIANKDTPNYKAFDLLVDEELQKLTDKQDGLSLRKTNPGHLPIGRSGDYSSITITEKTQGFPESMDGNTVDVEKEMTSLAENTLLYNATAQIIKRKFQGLKSVIAGGK